MKLGQTFAYERDGITFQPSDQRMHILIYQTEEVFNYVGFVFVLKSPLTLTQHLKQISTVEDESFSTTYGQNFGAVHLIRVN